MNDPHNAVKTTLAAVFVSLSFIVPLQAADISFDGTFDGDSLSETVSDLRAQAELPDRAPVPSQDPGSGISSEFMHFWDRLRNGVIDDVCRSVEVKLTRKAEFAEDTRYIDGGLKRYLRTLPSSNLALIDEVKVKMSAYFGREIYQIPDFGPLSVGITGGMEGRSIVVRPLENTRYCKELLTLARLYQVKTILPINAERISGMKKGEIWKMPFVVEYGLSGGAGTDLIQGVSISFNAGYVRQHKPSVTLYRMEDNLLRLRFRIETVTIKSVGASAQSVEIPAEKLGLIDAENFLAKIINKEVAKQINEAIAAKLGYEHTRTRGQKLLLEFYLDPNDAGQMAGLVEFLKGDLGVIGKFMIMGLRFNTFSEDESGQSGVNDINQLADAAVDGGLADSSFAGSDHYNSHSNNFNVQVPVIHTQNNSWSATYHRYQSLDNDGDTVHVHERSRVLTGRSVNIPFIGTLVKRESNKQIYVVNTEPTHGAASDPVMVYQQYEGSVRNNDISARAMINGANNVLKYAGMDGAGVNLGYTIPAAELFPAVPFDPTLDDGSNGVIASKTYRAVVMSFRLVFSEKAVQDIIFAAPNAIMRAYMNFMREVHSDVLDKVMDLFTINEEGEVKYDRRAAARRLGVSVFDSGEAANPLEIVRNLAYSATRMIKKMAGVRNESDWKQRSEKLASVAAGTTMGYEDFLKVVIQLVNVNDISARLYLHTDKRVKGEEDVTGEYSMFNAGSGGSAMAQVDRMRDRFGDPSTLTD